MEALIRERKKIRRFTDDAVPRELRASIGETVRSVSLEVLAKMRRLRKPKTSRE